MFVALLELFDSVSHIILINKLQHYDIRGLANNLVYSYLTNRQQCVSINIVNSNLEYVTHGVPQGSILGPLLFLIYINDLPYCLQTIPRFFADYTALLISENILEKTLNIFQSELCNVEKWMYFNNISVNPKKLF